MLQNAYFLAKIGADTAENEQHFAEICQKLAPPEQKAVLWPGACHVGRAHLVAARGRPGRPSWTIPAGRARDPYSVFCQIWATRNGFLFFYDGASLKFFSHGRNMDISVIGMDLWTFVNILTNLWQNLG